MKSVVDHMLEVAPRSQLRGLVDDYGEVDEQVLLLEGEIHLDRKPVSVPASTSRQYPRVETGCDLHGYINCASIHAPIHVSVTHTSHIGLASLHLNARTRCIC